MDNTVVWISLGVLTFLALLIAVMMNANQMPSCVGKSIDEATLLLRPKSIQLRNKIGSTPPPDHKFSLLGTIASIVKTDSPSYVDYTLYQLDVPNVPAYQPQTIQSLFDPVEMKRLQELQEELNKHMEEEHMLKQQLREEEEQYRQEQLRLERIEQERLLQEEWARQDKQREEQVQNHKRFTGFGLDANRERSRPKAKTKASFGW